MSNSPRTLTDLYIPQRPLSAYNIFFKETREKILTSKAAPEGNKSFDFQSMAKEIAARWKNLSPEERKRVEGLAKKDMERYREEVSAYEEKMVQKSRKEREESTKKAADAKGAPAPGVDLGFAAASSQRHQSGDFASSDDNLLGARWLLGGTCRPEVLQEHQRLFEELQAVEARAMQVRRLNQIGAGMPPNFQSQYSGLHSSFNGDMMLNQQLGSSSLRSSFGLGGSSLNPNLLASLSPFSRDGWLQDYGSQRRPPARHDWLGFLGGSQGP